MLYKLTPDEFTARKHILILSDKGLRFREEIKSQESLEFEDFHLPPINSAGLNQDSRIQVLRGEQPINILVDELKKDLEIKRPYIDKAINKFAEKLTTDKPSNQITNKLQKLYQELQKHTKLLEKRKVKFHKKSFEQPQEIKEQTSLLEVSEMQDKLASVNALEAKLQKMQQNYQNEIKIREDTLQKVKINAQLNRLQKEAEVEQVPVPIVVESSLKQSQYQDRKSVRLKDYQKYKFEKIWNKQPPPNYTSKQALLEQEKKKQQQLIKEQQEYELELQKRNGHNIQQ